MQAAQTVISLNCDNHYRNVDMRWSLLKKGNFPLIMLGISRF